MPNLMLLALLLFSLLLTILVLQSAQLFLGWLGKGILGNWCWQLLPTRFQQKLERYLQKTLSDQTPAHWLLVHLVKLLVVGMAVILPLPWIIKLGVILALVLPGLNAWQQRRNYRRQLMQQWPATLDVVAMTLHAGLSFRATLHTLSDSATVSVAFQELARMHAQQQAGFSLDEVLNEFVERIPHPQTALFRGAVLHAQKGGGALASSLEQQAQQARTLQLLAAEKSAQEASVKLLLPLLVCFFPVTFLLILGPVILSFMQGETL